MKNSFKTLLWQIEDERVKRLTKKAWPRIPAYDQAVLRGLIFAISDYVGEDNILGSAGPVDPTSVDNGCAGDVALNLDYYVNLGGVRKTRSDKAGMAVIAHEFAHVVLRHNQLGAVISGLRGLSIYSESDIETFDQYDEETADLLIWTWGFQDELRAYFDEFPNSFKPRWFVEIHTKEE